MKATFAGLAACVVACAAATVAQADNPPRPYIPQAPDACAPGYFGSNPYGATYGPNYYLRPPYPPYVAVPLCPPGQQQQGPLAFPTHPFARSPRDFFMLDWDR